MSLGSVSDPGVAPPAPGRPGSSSRGVVYEPPGSCTHPSRCSMHRSSPRAVTGSSRLMGGSLHSESISLGRRVGVVLSGEGSGGYRAGCPCGSSPGSPAHSQHSRLPPPAPMRRAAVASDWEPGSSGGCRSESRGLNVPWVDSWAPSGAFSTPRGPIAGAPLVGQWPAWRTRGPHSESCVLPHVGQGPV
jgi:hypothetical protein